MAKKAAAAEQEELFDVDDAHPQVKRAATAYKKASEEKSKAGSSYNAKRDNLIEAMKEHGCDACAVELGGVRKIIRLSSEDKLKIETAKESPAAGE